MGKEPTDREKLSSLDERIRAARAASPEGRARARAKERGGRKADGVAWRISVELVAAFLVCGFVGWWADEWLGTRPWAMLVGLLLGGVVGIRNVYAVAMRVQREAEEAADEGRDG